MTPPEAPELGSDASRGTHAPAVLSCPEIRVLKKRAAFLAAARARRQGTGGFLLQARRRGDDDAAIGVGFTCSKKVGNAVARNRAKRRLRAIARTILPDQGQPGWDYVLIGRAAATATRPFPDLLRDLSEALDKVHA